MQIATILCYDHSPFPLTCAIYFIVFFINRDFMFLLVLYSLNFRHPVRCFSRLSSPAKFRCYINIFTLANLICLAEFQIFVFALVLFPIRLQLLICTEHLSTDESGEYISLYVPQRVSSSYKYILQRTCNGAERNYHQIVNRV